MKTRHIALAVFAGLAAGSSAFAQAGTGFTITDGNTIYTRGVTPTTVGATGPTVDFRVGGPASPDQLFGNFWWYRVDGADTRENIFNNQAGPTVVAGNTATQNYIFPNFNATLTYMVQATGASFGQVLQTVAVTNTAPNAITLNLFNYADFFLNGQDAGDVVTLVNPTFMRVTDAATPNSMEFEGPGASRYQAGPFNSIRGALTNAVVNDLTNTVDGTPGDREGAFQWILEIPVGGSVTVGERIAIVPAPGAVALLGLGGLVAGRRRRA